MSNTALLIPLFVQVALILGLMIWLATLRVRAANRGEVRLNDIALDSTAWPEQVRKVGNSVLNQFQLPLLFFIVCVLLIVTSGVTVWQVALAWVFVASRFVHAWIHTGVNHPIHRFYAFVTGFTALTLMWILCGVGIFMKNF